MAKGTASMGMRGRGKSHIICRRCGKHSMHASHKICSACGFGATAKRRSYNFIKK